MLYGLLLNLNQYHVQGARAVSGNALDERGDAQRLLRAARCTRGMHPDVIQSDPSFDDMLLPMLE